MDQRDCRFGPRQALVVGVLSAVIGFVWIGASAAAEKDASPAAALTPEQTVTRYLQALKDGQFAAAYDQMSKGMGRGKTRDEWAKEQQWQMQMSDAKIFEFHIYPSKIEADKAFVPNLLSSQDKFLNQLGVPEHELYTLIREDGRWKIDQQQLLEHTEQHRWFPSTAQDK